MHNLFKWPKFQNAINRERERERRICEEVPLSRARNEAEKSMDLAFKSDCIMSCVPVSPTGYPLSTHIRHLDPRSGQVGSICDSRGAKDERNSGVHIITFWADLQQLTVSSNTYVRGGCFHNGAGSICGLFKVPKVETFTWCKPIHFPSLSFVQFPKYVFLVFPKYRYPRRLCKT